MAIKYNMTPLTISVHPEGHNPVFSECATHISIDAVKLLKSGMDEKDFD